MVRCSRSSQQSCTLHKITKEKHGNYINFRKISIIWLETSFFTSFCLFHCCCLLATYWTSPNDFEIGISCACSTKLQNASSDCCEALLVWQTNQPDDTGQSSRYTRYGSFGLHDHWSKACFYAMPCVSRSSAVEPFENYNFLFFDTTIGYWNGSQASLLKYHSKVTKFSLLNYWSRSLRWMGELLFSSVLWLNHFS